MAIANRVKDFQEGRLEWREFCDDIYRYCTKFLRTQGYSCEESHDIFTYSEEKIKRVCKNFVFMGYSFESYLNQSLIYYKRNLRRREHQKVNKEHLYYSSCVLSAHEAVKVISGDDDKSDLLYNLQADFTDPIDILEEAPLFVNSRKSKDINSLKTHHKRIFLISLKNCMHMCDKKIKELSDFIGIDQEMLWNLHHQLRILISGRMEKKILKRNNEFIRKIKGYIVEKRTHINITPTNKEISDITGFAKGTIDSVLYYARRMVDGGMPQEVTFQ